MFICVYRTLIGTPIGSLIGTLIIRNLTRNLMESPLDSIEMELNRNLMGTPGRNPTALLGLAFRTCTSQTIEQLAAGFFWYTTTEFKRTSDSISLPQLCICTSKSLSCNHCEHTHPHTVSACVCGPADSGCVVFADVRGAGGPEPGLGKTELGNLDRQMVDSPSNRRAGRLFRCLYGWRVP